MSLHTLRKNIYFISLILVYARRLAHANIKSCEISYIVGNEAPVSVILWNKITFSLGSFPPL